MKDYFKTIGGALIEFSQVFIVMIILLFIFIEFGALIVSLL